MIKIIKKNILLMLISSFIMVSPLSVLAHGGGVVDTDHSMMGDSFMNMGSYSGGMTIGWIFMVAFWLLVIFGVIWLVKNLISQNDNSEIKDNHKALDILKERYAKSEIDKKEFEEKKKDLL